MTYAEQLTAQIRNAHLIALKQRYLDLIEEAQHKKKTSEQDYYDEARQAYIDQQRGFRDTPQQFSALGLSGGRGDDELGAIITSYEDTLEKLRRRRSSLADGYEGDIERQTRLMDNEVNEYLARIALEDYSSALKKSKKGSGASSGAKNQDSAVSEPAPQKRAPQDLMDFMKGTNYQLGTNRKKTSI